MEFCDPDEITIDGVNHGFINSQNYPNPYDNRLDCDIIFLPAQHELSMELYVHDFHLERNFDFLTIVTSNGTYEYHGRGAAVGWQDPEAMRIGETYYCKYISYASSQYLIVMPTSDLLTLCRKPQATTRCLKL